MFRVLFGLLLACLLAGVLAIVGVATYLLPRLPSIEMLKDVRLQVPLRVYTHDGSLIAEFGEKRRAPIKLKDAPDLLVRAILAAEDDRFYEHPGVDWQAILRASLQLARTGEKSQGGSTITMQVARNFFLSREKTFLRKLNEILLALKIERELSKDDILELYLNKIYLGNRAYGVLAAAQTYYGVSLAELNLAQMAMIAGLPKAPSTMNPIADRNRATERRNYILGRMLERGYINQEDHRAALSFADNASVHTRPPEVSAPYVAEMVRSYMVEQYGEDVYDRGLRVYTTLRDGLQNAANDALQSTLVEYDQRHGFRGPEQTFQIPNDATEREWSRSLRGYHVVGGLVPALVITVTDTGITAFTQDFGLVQIEGEGLARVKRYLAKNGNAGKSPQTIKPGKLVRLSGGEKGDWRVAQVPEVEGALVSLDANNGAVLALVGGFDFSRSKFNRATQAHRQPGSSFKPFIYSAALEVGYTAASIFNDAPIAFYEPGLPSVWRPENYTRTYHGPTRLRDALAHSRNLVSIRVLQAVGINRVVSHVSRFGFNPTQLPHNLSLALGTGTVTPYELAAAYTVFANGGFRVVPYFIERIESDIGELLMDHRPLTVCQECVGPRASNLEIVDPIDAGNATEAQHAPRVLDAQNAWVTNSMLQDVIRIGTARAARSLQRQDLAGKTGTTNEQKDAWFTGFNGNVVTTTWVGFDQSTPLGKDETGARAALPMWIKFMRVALAGMPETFMPEPAGLVKVRIDADSGLLTNAENPNAIFESFPVNSVPIRESPLIEYGDDSEARSSNEVSEDLF